MCEVELPLNAYEHVNQRIYAVVSNLSFYFSITPVFRQVAHDKIPLVSVAGSLFRRYRSFASTAIEETLP